MCNKIIRYLFCSLMVFSFLYSQIEISQAVFKEKDSLSRLEVYYKIPKKDVEFIKGENQYYSELHLETFLMQNDTLHTGKKWSIKHRVKDTANIDKDKSIIEVSKFRVPPGKYNLKVLVRDGNSGEKFENNREVEIKSFQGNKVMISDLALGQKIAQSSDTNRFSFHGKYDIIPEVDAVLGDNNFLYYPYFELYGSNSDTVQYKLKYKIIDIDEQIVKETAWINQRKAGRTIFDLYTKGIDVSNISSGSYSLNLELILGQRQDTIRASKDIFVVNSPKNNTRGMSEDKLKDYTENQLDSVFYPLQFLATKEEQNRYKSADKEGKIEFLAEFWDSRDPNPTTKINERRRNFERKLIYADNRFGRGDTPGWKQDRGRVLVLYGEPLEIERETQDIDTKPHIIWKYNDLENPVKFIFLKEEEEGGYNLIHSDARGEIKNRRWRQMVSEDGQAPLQNRRRTGRRRNRRRRRRR